MARVRWAVRCRARAKSTGRACRAWAIEGGYTCWAHGGAAPQVRRAAERRWELVKAERRLIRKLGRPLTPVEFALLTGDQAALRRAVRTQLSHMRIDARIALARLKASLDT